MISDRCRPRRVIVSLIALVVCISACRDRGTDGTVDSHPSSPGGMESPSVRFSGSVRSLGADERPVDTLTMTRHLGDTLSFGLITAVHPVGKYLVAVDRFTSPHILVLDREHGELRGRFGRDGEGPGEFRDPSGIFVVDHESREFWIYDFSNGRATLVRLDPLGEAQVQRHLRLQADHSLETPAWVGDGIVATGLFPDFALLVMDKSGVPRRRVGSDLPHAQLASLQGGLQANRSFMAVSPKRDRLALAYQFASRIDFFTPIPERYGMVQGPRATQLRYRAVGNRLRWEDDNEVAYWGADATDDYVFFGFCGCPVRNGDELPDRLHVFRWNGDFVAEIALDRPLMAFSVAPDGTRLYGAFVEPYPGLGEWRLPERFHAVGDG